MIEVELTAHGKLILEAGVLRHVRAIEIDGILYSREIFKFFGFDAEAGDLFRFVKRGEGGITLTRIDEAGGDRPRAENPLP